MKRENGLISEKFDNDLWIKVRTARRKRNELAGKIIYPTFESLYPENGRQFGHKWEGAKLFDKEKKRTVTIESVHHHWYKGWFVMILYYTEYEHFGETKHSHGQLYFENINCWDETVLECIAKDRSRYSIIEQDEIDVQKV